MFAPALLLQAALGALVAAPAVARLRRLARRRRALVLWAAAPWDRVGLAVAQGAAWGLAWGGLLWAPDAARRAGSSPLRRRGYALLTMGVGLVVERFGAPGVAAVHVALGLAAAAAVADGPAAQSPGAAVAGAGTAGASNSMTCPDATQAVDARRPAGDAREAARRQPRRRGAAEASLGQLQYSTSSASGGWVSTRRSIVGSSTADRARDAPLVDAARGAGAHVDDHRRVRRRRSARAARRP